MQTSNIPALPAFVGAPDMNRVYHCRAEDLLAALPTGSVDLIVTSPPYDNLRTYKGFSWDFEYIARQSYRVLKHGGVLVWVVGDGMDGISESLTSFEQALYFRRNVGFALYDTMIYGKTTYAAPQNPVLRYAQSFEYMFVFSKGEPRARNIVMRQTESGERMGRTIRKRQPNGTMFETTVKGTGAPMSNIWMFTTGGGHMSQDAEVSGHPAVYPEELAERHILTWSNPGDLVVDFFGGSGTTAKMARINARRWITCDISEEYCELMRRRLAQPYTPDMFALAELQGASA